MRERTSTRPYVAFLNPDAVVSEGALRRLRDRLAGAADAGVCGAAVVQQQQGVTEYGATIDRLGHPIGLFEPREPLFVTGKRADDPP